MGRRIFAVCIAMLLWLSCSHAVWAEEWDSGKTGSISVTLVEPKQNEPIVGAALSVYHVATVTADAEGVLRYAYTDAFASFDVALDDAALATKLDAYLPQEGVPCTTVITDATGTAVCADLALGLYFVKQTGAADGFAPCAPFLVTVPYAQGDGYVYAVNASPKTEVARLTAITIKKVWNTDESTHATDSVTVQLLRGDAVIATAVLSEQNNWQVTYTDMPESDVYRIREVDVPQGFTATYAQNGYVFIVTNTSTLPQTGQLMWPIPVLAGVGLLLIAVGVMLLQKKRKTHA